MVNHHLKTFIIAADSGSFIKAGARLYVSPNAVAKQINLLEQHLGLTLFERTRQGLKLTPEGTYIYKEAKKMICRSNEVLKNARQIRAAESTVIRVGTSLMNPYYILQARWLQVAGQAPDITLQIEPYRDETAEFQSILSHLGEKIDVIPCLYDETFYMGKCRILHLDSQPARIGIPAQHHLAFKSQLGWKDLNHETIIMMNADRNPILASIKNDILSHCSDAKIEESETMDYHVFNRAVNENKLIVTVECWRDVHPMVRTLPVDWDYTFQYGVIYPLKANPVVLRFIDLLQASGV